MTNNIPISVKEVQKLASKVAFGDRLVSNMYRGLVAEVIVASVLSPSGWEHCSKDWSGWDFEHRVDGTKLEVKQSAALQTWSDGKLSKAVFSIAASKGFYTGSAYTEDSRRKSSIYVFAHHYIDGSSANHCDPEQWNFYVLPESKLPCNGKTIALSVMAKLCTDQWKPTPGFGMPCKLASLGAFVDFLQKNQRNVGLT